jgi:hypothetical protein
VLDFKSFLPLVMLSSPLAAKALQLWKMVAPLIGRRSKQILGLFLKTREMDQAAL